jgi:O-antigen ligase/Tfp pilus assembly protein PilF
MDGSKIYDILIESLLVLLLVFTPPAYGAVHPWSITLFEIIAALMAMLWMFKMLSTGKFEFISNPFTPFIFVFILYVSLQFFISGHITPNSQLLTPNSIYSWATKAELLKLISYAIIFHVTLNTIKTKRQITRILSVIITMGFSMSIFYLMRYFGAPTPRGFINPDHFSAYLGMIIPLSLGFLLVPSLSSETRPSAKPPRKGTTYDLRPLLFFFVLIMSAALFFTMSRGGMFSFIAALLFIAFLVSTRQSIKKKGWIILAIAVFIILVIAWLGATPVVERILSVKAEIASRYYGGRLPIWQGTLSIIRDYPIFGTGLGTFNYIFPKYQPLAIINKHYTYAHSDILELLSEVGIVGFILFLACGIWYMVYLFKHFYRRHNPWIVGMSLCVFGSLAAIFLHSFTDFNLHIPANAVLLTVILALFVSILQVDNHSPEVAHGRVRIIGYSVAVLAAGLLVVYAIAIIRPAIAGYYANTAPAGQQGIEAAIRLDPSNAEYHYKLGRLYGKSKAYELQFAEYQSAVRLNPTNSQYHQSLAWAYGQMKNVSQAQHEFGVAIELNPNYYYPYQVYAIWLFNHPTKENIEKGVVTYKKAITLNPALAKEALDRYCEYQNDYAQLLNILPGTKGSDAIFLKYLLAEENIDYAIQFAGRFLKSYKENAECFFWIADKASYDKAYGWDFVKAYYLKALELDPNNAFYRYWYAVQLFRNKQYAASDDQFGQVIKLDSRYTEKIKMLKNSGGGKAE